MSYRNRGRDPVYSFGVRLLWTLEKLTSVSGETFDVPALPLCVKSVECQAGFATSTHAANHHKLTVRNVEIDIFQVMYTDTAKFDGVSRQVYLGIVSSLRNVRSPRD